MNIVYEKMKALVPFKTCIKEREDTDFLIVSNEDAEIIYLNETSKEFYALCDGKRNVEQILDELLAVYDVARGELEQDIIGLIRDLQWNDVVHFWEVAR